MARKSKSPDDVEKEVIDSSLPGGNVEREPVNDYGKAPRSERANDPDDDPELPEGGDDDVATPQKALYEELELGDDWKDKPVEEIARHLHGERQKTSSSSEEAVNKAYQQAFEYARNQIFSDPRWEGYEKWLADQQAEQGKKTEDGPWWSPPKANMQLVNKYFVENPETKEKNWLPNTPAEVREQADAYTAYIENWQHNLLFGNPEEALAPLIERVARRISNESVQQTMAQERRQATLQKIENANEEWLYVQKEVKDASGHTIKQKVVDPRTGLFMLTEPGQQTYHIWRKLDDGQNTEEAFHLAMRAVMGDYALGGKLPGFEQKSSGKRADAAPEKSGAEKDIEYLKNAAKRASSRGGSAASAGTRKPQQNKKLSDEEKILAAFERDGVKFDD